MLFVLMVLSLMALSLGTLSWHVGANIAETRRAITAIRTESGCASALDLAGRTVNAVLATDPNVDPAEVTDAICALGTCATVDGVRLPSYLAPPGTTLEHFALAFGSPLRSTTRTITDGPFADRVAIEKALVMTVSVKDALTGRICEQTDRFVIPSLPITSFPIFDTAPQTRWAPPLSVRRSLDGDPSRIHVNGNKTGTQLDPLDFVLPGPQSAPEPLPIDLVGSTRGSDQVLRSPVQAPTPSSLQSSLEANFRWLIEPPTSSDSDTLRRTRLAHVADVVVIDGVWYNNRDKSLPWPGVPIASDRVGTTISHVSPASSVVAAPQNVGIGDLDYGNGDFPRLYSWYDRETATGPIRNDQVATGGGILSYGPLAVIETTTTCSVDEDCAFLSGGECRRTATSGRCIRLEPGLWPSPTGGSDPCSSGSTLRGISECATAVVNRALVDGSRSGFRDDDINISPININVRTLATALLSPAENELGWALGVPAGGPGRFNGVLYVTSRFSGTDLPEQNGQDGGVGPRPLCEKSTGSGVSFGACPPAAAASVHDPRAQFVVPVGLCGTAAPLTGTSSNDFQTQPCDTASRPNAVRIFGGGHISAGAFPRGLTIVSDLPVYVLGDLNKIEVTGSPPVAKPHVKVAVVGDRVTFLSRGWRDRDHPWNVSPATLPATGVMTVEASIITGLPLRSGDVHDIADAWRALQPFDDNHFIMRGHVIAGWNAEFIDDDNSSRRVNRGLRWLPDYHLKNPGFQPPGMPTVNLPPSGRWRQR
jgi:hypothetical protein